MSELASESASTVRPRMRTPSASEVAHERMNVPGYTEMKALGAGGFGAVVLARHDATGTPVAIKFLRPDLLADQGFAAMFRAEAVTLGALDSPYVVRLYEYVEGPAGAAIVMELVDGVSLHEIVTRQGKTTPEAALLVLYGSLLGLAAAHARGVVHRDFEPGERARQRVRRQQADRLRHRRADREHDGARRVAVLRPAGAVRRRPGHPGERRLRGHGHLL